MLSRFSLIASIALVAFGCEVLHYDEEETRTVEQTTGAEIATTNRTVEGEVEVGIERDDDVGAPAPEGVPCTSTADCGEGAMCLGGEGCGMQWTCVPQRVCTRDLVRYCGCNGETFTDSGTCPSQPYEHRGACEGDEGSSSGRECSSTDDCAAGEMCTGSEGCGVPWTCQAARACTMDLVTFCGCDGQTFQGSSTCPTRPYSRRGECESPIEN